MPVHTRARHAVVAAAAAAALLAPAVASTSPAAEAAPPTATGTAAARPVTLSYQPAADAPVQRCVVRDDRLAELSGLAADGERWYAVADGGRRLQVLVLRKDCTVQRVITAAVDPFDIEDLALGPDGKLWLADIGDNDQQRQTVALHVLGTDGSPPQLHRLTYPDGAHDAEALLLDRDGNPYIITKQAFGRSGVYRPVAPLQGPGPTALELVTSVRFARTDTPGGPVGSASSTVVTGGASSADGRVVALRTYTDAYLFPVADGDLVAALGAKPVQVPLADEPQGEAIAFEPDGTLLTASERAQAGPQPVRAVPGAAELATPAAVATGQPSTPGQEGSAQGRPAEPGDDRRLSTWQAVLIAVLGAAAVIALVGRLARRR